MERRFPARAQLDALLPVPTAQRMCDMALQTWGPHALEPERSLHPMWVLVRSRSAIGTPLGGCRLRWNHPGLDQVTVTEVGWDPEAGGDRDSVVRALNGLVGWPVLRSAIP